MKTILGLITILILGLAISGQTPSTGTNKMSPEESMLMKVVDAQKLFDLCFVDLSNHQCDGRKPDRELTAAFTVCVNDKKCAPLLISNIVAGYAILTTGRLNSSDLISEGTRDTNVKMQMILIAQNQRIIDLLEQIAKKKP